MAKQRLKQAMHGGRGDEVAAADDVGHALQRIVDDHRQMVARCAIAAAEDDIAPDRRPAARSDRRRLRHIRPRKGALARRRAHGHIEAEGRPVAAREAGAPFGLEERAASPRVERRIVRVAPAPRRARHPSGCKNTGTPSPCCRDAPPPPRSPRHVRSGGAKAAKRIPSQARSPRSRPRTRACSERGPSLQCAESDVRLFRRRCARS